MSDDGAFRGVELRVHGIGDHDVYSAIGSPPVIDDSDRATSTAELPHLPRHPLQFLNWSRTSRRLARVLWYFALPFSLVNTAGHMVPAREEGGRAAVRWLAGCVVLVSLITTAVAYLWVVAIGETVLRMLRIGASADAGLILVTSLAVVGAVAVVFRCIHLVRMTDSSHEQLANGEREATSVTMRRWLTLGLGAAHLAMIIVVAALIVSIRPSQLPAPSWLSGIRIFTTPRRLSESGHVDLNSLNLVVIGSMALVVVVSLVILLASIRRRYRSLGGMAMALLASILLLHAFGSAIRVGINWILVYLDQFVSLSAIDRETSLAWSGRYFMPYQPPGGGLFSYFYDTIPLLAILALISLGIGVAVVNAVMPNGPRFTNLFRGTTRRDRYIHRTITELRSRLGLALFIGMIVWALALFWVIATIADRNPGRFDRVVLDVVVIATNVIAVLSALFVITGGRIGLLRRTFAITADIIGFWSVAWHPLGGRSYRRPVVDGIASDMDTLLATSERVVLVGHSQGSVLSVWYLAHHNPGADAVVLITCGSPVSSLYCTFFPRFFDTALMRSARASVHGWSNFWRDTDPIATPLQPELGSADPPISDEQLPDPRSGCDADTPKGHGDYWNERELKLVSEGWLAPTAAEVEAAG
ncbi:MAG: integral rane protein [Agromyces sp.]|jgi:hypothetical protein|nr:integral rane protein [Agromyces sp.]